MEKGEKRKEDEASPLLPLNDAILSKKSSETDRQFTRGSGWQKKPSSGLPYHHRPVNSSREGLAIFREDPLKNRLRLVLWRHENECVTICLLGTLPSSPPGNLTHFIKGKLFNTV